MKCKRPNTLFSIGLAVVAMGLLSAFSYPLVQEGYDSMQSDVYRKEQIKIIEQSIAQYVCLKPDVGWSVNTPTREILNDLATGLDMSFSGKPQSLLPASVSPETLEHEYRIVYKGPQNYRVISR